MGMVEYASRAGGSPPWRRLAHDLSGRMGTAGYAPLRPGSGWVLATSKAEGVRKSWTTTRVRNPKTLTGITKGGSLDTTNRQEGEGDDGFGQHVEDENDERGVWSLE